MGAQCREAILLLGGGGYGYDAGAAGPGNLDGMDSESSSCTRDHSGLPGLEPANVSQRVQRHPHGTIRRDRRARGQHP